MMNLGERSSNFVDTHHNIITLFSKLHAATNSYRLYYVLISNNWRKIPFIMNWYKSSPLKKDPDSQNIYIIHQPVLFPLTISIKKLNIPIYLFNLQNYAESGG